MKFRFLIVLLVLTLVTLPFVNADYSYYRTITINQSKVSGNNVDFPVLFSGTYSYLATISNGGLVTNSNGYDIGFFSSSSCGSSNKLNWETELYNATNGNVVYWVKIPSINSTENTTFYLCYSDSSITSDQSNRTGVWDSRYDLVWHLSDYTGTNINDSSSKSRNGTKAGSTGPDAYSSSKISGGQRFIAGETPSNNIATGIGSYQNFTAELWINHTVTDTYGTLIATSTGFRPGLYIRDVDNLVDFYDGTTEFFSTRALSDNVWYHLTFVKNNTNFTMYINGVVDSSHTVNAEALYLQYLGYSSNTNEELTGIMDEVRISNYTRSAGWILTNFNNQNQTTSFYSVSSESFVGSGGVNCFFYASSTCPSGSIKFIGLQNELGGYSNAHAQNYSSNTYAYSICCNSTQASATISNTCGTPVLKLSSQSNAHVEIGSNSNYTYSACLSSSSSRNFTCNYPTSSCSSSYSCIASIEGSEGSSTSNAHIGMCGDYNQKICCGYQNSPPTMFSVRIYPTPNASDQRDLIGYCNATDVDGDNLNLQHIWYVNNEPYFRGITFKNSSLSVGGYHACAIRANDSRVMCWGYNSNGQLGIGNTSNYYYPVLINDTAAYSKITTGTTYTCGIRANDSNLRCWGHNVWFMLGDGTNTNRYNPTSVNSSDSFFHVAGGDTHTCAIRNSDLRAVCWGYNSNGQIGNGTVFAGASRNPTLVNDTSAYKDIDIGSAHTCGIRANDSLVYCWGYNWEGQLGTGFSNDGDHPNPEKVNTTASYLSVSLLRANTGSSGIRANDSRGFAWGRNFEYQLGTTQNDQFSWVSRNPRLINTTSPLIKISLGSDHGCAITSNFTLICWGTNTYGQLGIGNTTTYTYPITVDSGTSYLDVGAGERHTCAITKEGEIRCWGYNVDGQIGNGNTSQSNYSLPIVGAKSIISLYNQSVEYSLSSYIHNKMTIIGQNWTLSCMAMDNESNSNFLNSTATQITNRTLIVTLIYPLNQNTSVFERYVNFTWSLQNDSEAGATTFSVNATCGAACSCASINFGSISDTNYTDSQPLCYDVNYNWSITACDSTNYCTTSSTWNFTIASVLDFVLISNSSDFGAFSLGQTKDTLTNSPNPLVGRNNGNVLVNATVNATALFNSVNFNSSYYQFLAADNETSSIVAGCSQTSFENMSLTQKNLLCNLSYIDSRDEARIDINITVPVSEGSGEKNSVLEIVAYSAG